MNEDELGRRKHNYTPTEHLEHLLNLGWDPNSPLIKKYVQNNGLKHQLDEWKEQKAGKTDQEQL